MPKRWVNLLGSITLGLVAGGLVGFWLGEPAWALVVVLALCLARLLYGLYVFDRFLSTGAPAPLVRARGFWPALIAKLEKLRIKSLNRKKRYLRVVRQVKDSTDAIRDAGVILNSEYEIVWFNPAATEILGLDPEKDIGHRIDNLIRHPKFVSFLRDPSDDGIAIPAPRRQGGTVEISLVPYGGRQFLAIARDITHETQLERARRDFVANASHELRSPLTVISGYLDALADDDEMPESWETPVSEMLHQTNRMTQILRDLIELARLETSEDTAERNPVDVPRLLQEILEHYEIDKDRPSMTLDLQTDSQLLGSESDLYSVFRNLLDNAVRFTPKIGSVTATWRRDGESAVLEVADDGIGIPEDQIPRLTERFYRVDKGRSRATGGTGLGLAIVKHALQRHGATLEITSVEGRGSTFACRFPAHRTVEEHGADSAVI